MNDHPDIVNMELTGYGIDQEPVLVGNCGACGEELYEHEADVCRLCDKDIHDECVVVCAQCGDYGCKGCKVFGITSCEYFCNEECKLECERE